jgi:hypothetical protein
MKKWIELAQDKAQRQTCDDGFIKAGNFFTS